jgi:CheY-like chemotaxis protein
MNEILLVDDDANLLSGVTRSMHGLYRMHTATSGRDALAILEKTPAIAVILSDMRMPEMDGVSFLAAARQSAPDAVRIMLTGNADQTTAVNAINEGNIFRFVCKPASRDKLVAAIDAGLRQHQLVIAERQLLERTVAGSIQALTEILSMFDERSFGKCTTLRNLVRKCAHLVPAGRLWEVETAAMLAPIGSVAIPSVVMTRARQGAVLTNAEKRMLERIPEVGFQLLAKIPRLEPVAELVRAMASPFTTETSVGTRLLQILRGAMERCGDGRELPAVLAEMQREGNRFDQRMLADVARSLQGDRSVPTDGRDLVEELPLSALREGRVTAKAIVSREGTTLVGAGQVLTNTTLERLRNFAATQGLVEPISLQRTLVVPAVQPQPA